MSNLREKPFALVGVNLAGNDPRALAKVVAREDLTWRSFADPDCEIAARWNVSATPTLYLLDARGVIRHKWVGAPGSKVIDAAIEAMLDETGSGKK